MRDLSKRLVTFTGIAALSAAGLLGSVSRTPKQTSGQDRFISEIETVLAMTPAQKDQAQTAFQDARRSAMPVRQQLMDTRAALQTAIRSDDTAQIQRLSTNEGQEIGQLIAIRNSALAKVYKTLTPDQKQRADALRDVLMQQMQGRMEHGASHMEHTTARSTY